jgi:serine/threonine protein phosphatase PrpC
MHAAEGRAVGAALAELGTEVTDVVQGVHRAVATRLHASRVHHAVSDAVYGTVRTGLRTTGTVGGFALATVVGSGPSLADSRTGARALGFVQGVIGDELARREDVLAGSVTWRHEGRELEPGAHAEPRSRVVVFLHGLTETEQSWWRTPRGLKPSPSYGEQLAAHGWSDLYLRYPTGIGLQDNAKALVALLTETIEAWPVPVTELALVGHSLGGLLARAACLEAAEQDEPPAWFGALTAVVTLAAPHQGAPLARAAARATASLERFPETRPFAHLLAWRSQGIRDLEAESYPPLVPGARHTVVAATIARDTSSRWADLFGDGMVRPVSASGPEDPAVSVHRVGGLHHRDVLNHPRVWPVVETAVRAARRGQAGEPALTRSVSAVSPEQRLVEGPPPWSAVGATAPGLVRGNNEDALLVDARLLAVADGLGGHAAGEVASAAACAALGPALAASGDLAQAIAVAHGAVLEAGERARAQGAGTTMVAVWLPEDATEFVVAHVGDSRAALSDADGFRWITRDHNVAREQVDAGLMTEDEARQHGGQHQLTRALGVGDPEPPPADVATFPLRPGRLLVCSDGLCGYVPDSVVAERVAVGTPVDAVLALVRAAYELGAPDNVTVVVADLPTSG